MLGRISAGCLPRADVKNNPLLDGWPGNRQYLPSYGVLGGESHRWPPSRAFNDIPRTLGSYAFLKKTDNVGGKFVIIMVCHRGQKGMEEEEGEDLFNNGHTILHLFLCAQQALRV